MKQRVFFKRTDGHKSHISGLRRALANKWFRKKFIALADSQVKHLSRQLKITQEPE